MKIILFIFFFLFAPHTMAQTERPLVIGSFIDVEGRILGEMFAQLLEDRGVEVKRQLGLGGPTVCFEALKAGEIDLYPEYSGNIQAQMNRPHALPYRALQQVTKETFGFELLDPLGFNNTYAFVVRTETAKKFHLKRISDLVSIPGLRYGLSHDFLRRFDGWPGLAKLYGIKATPLGIDHGLSYQALAQKKVDLIDAYSTDGKLKKFDLVFLEDDRHFFPLYLAGPLIRPNIDKRAKEILGELTGKLSDEKMQSINALVELDGKSFAEAAEHFLREADLLEQQRTLLVPRKWQELLQRTFTHIWLSAAALFLAMVIAIPLGILVYRFRFLAQPLLTFTSILQTIPSIALLAFMIPLFGIGVKPAIIALFLYALLPIARNTTTALLSIDPVLKKVSLGMGLSSWQQLRYIEFPLSMPHILAGIRTAAVMTIGTATLAAFIGAGGLGEPIVAGLNLNNPAMVMEGAIPSALLAILTEYGFELLERCLIPKHLTQKVSER